ncbi:MAG: hypothetical protein ACLQBD_05370 [Syntrophobacteraceae bacterium]
MTEKTARGIALGSFVVENLSTLPEAHALQVLRGECLPILLTCCSHPRNAHPA